MSRHNNNLNGNNTRPLIPKTSCFPAPQSPRWVWDQAWGIQIQDERTWHQEISRRNQRNHGHRNIKKHMEENKKAHINQNSYKWCRQTPSQHVEGIVFSWSKGGPGFFPHTQSTEQPIQPDSIRTKADQQLLMHKHTVTIALLDLITHPAQYSIYNADLYSPFHKIITCNEFTCN